MASGTLGLDLATQYGWSYVDAAGSYVASGHSSLRAWDSIAQRCVSLRNAIADLVTRFDPAIIAIEEPILNHANSYRTARALYPYATAAEEVAHHRECRFLEIGRKTCCKQVLGDGHGNAGKAEGVVFARRFKPFLNSDDEADAVLVALAAHAMGGVKPVAVKKRVVKRKLAA